MRTVTEHYPGASPPQITETIQQIWDHHSDYQWTYFLEEVKQNIELFLEQRLTGKNLDLGGGWYLHYPNSDVIDISSKALEFNLAPKERRHQIDLDDIADGKKLPFEDKTFDSATFINSLPYVKDPWALATELERVLKPGAEVYAINQEGAGLPECFGNQMSRSSTVVSEFAKHGYDTLVENIPDAGGQYGYPGGAFKSVCIAFPRKSKLSAHRREYKQKFSAKEFMKKIAEKESEIEISKLEQINDYPITKYSFELKEKIEKLSQEYHSKTGNTPIFFSDISQQVEFDMSLPKKEAHISCEVLTKDSK